MKDQKLREKILEIEKSTIPDLIPRTSQVGITKFFNINDKLDIRFNEEFEGLWQQLEYYYGKYMEEVLPGKYDKAVHKKVLKDVINEEVKYIFYGKIYEMAKNDLDDPVLEDLLSFDERTGFFELKNTEEVVDYIINGLFFTAFTVIGLSEGKVEDLSKKIRKLQNRYGTYPKELFIEAYKIQEENKGKRPKVTDEDAIVLANEKLELYPPEELIDSNGQKTYTLLMITKTYSNYHKPKLKRGKGEY